MSDDLEDEAVAGPEEVRDYIHDMLKELSHLARGIGDLFVADALLMILNEVKRSPQGAEH